MELHSLKFIVFFIIVFVLYYAFQKKKQLQNIILLVASYVFYAMASLKIVPILLLMTAFFYIMGRAVERKNVSDDEKGASILTTITIVVGLLPLIYFKYFGFFVEQVQGLFASFGFGVGGLTLKILLPLGLSFYTFRLISYIVEINQYGISAEKDVIAFGAYVAFFPSLIAGPIDKPNVFLPQLQVARTANYDNLVEGLKRFVWGWFMKVCLADRIVSYTDVVLPDYASQNGATLLFAILLLPLHTYADFAGYSHMAIGISKMLGLTSAENFNRPFFAQNISEFWKRWHMSLTNWVTNYVYTPLNFTFRKKGKYGMMLAVMLNMLIVGIWHRAGWDYILFGLYHALLFVPLILFPIIDKNSSVKLLKGWLVHPTCALKMGIVYVLVAISFLFVNMMDISDGWSVVCGIFNHWDIVKITSKSSLFVALFCGCIVFLKDYIDEFIPKLAVYKSNKIIPSAIVLSLVVFLTLICRSDAMVDFVYMKF